MAEEEHAAGATGEEYDPHYEPVIKLTEQVAVKTNEEDEDVLFKMRAKLFRFDKSNSEWKERGTGEVRLLQDRGSSLIRLVMRRDKTLKVCANHMVTSEMKLSPNVGSDRSWVWSVAADYAEGEPTTETMAIRFANSDNANHFKQQFEHAQENNSKQSKKPAAESKSAAPAAAEEKPAAAETTDDTDKLEKAMATTSIAKQPSAEGEKTVDSSSQAAVAHNESPAQAAADKVQDGDEKPAVSAAAKDEESKERVEVEQEAVKTETAREEKVVSTVESSDKAPSTTEDKKTAEPPASTEAAAEEVRKVE